MTSLGSDDFGSNEDDNACDNKMCPWESVALDIINDIFDLAFYFSP